MEGSQNFGHEHPLVLLNEEHISNQSEEAYCSLCEENLSAPCFSCFQCAGYYVHKKCAEAPLEINHPFHPDHPLVLLPSLIDNWYCYSCGESCYRFVYRCSCRLTFHAKCALFTYNFAEKNLKELEHVALEDPLISAENYKKNKCIACWEPLAYYTYFSPDCGFNLHKKCVNLPLKINDRGHKHPLSLQFGMMKRSFCKICYEETKGGGFVYCCSPCKFVVHVECVSPLHENQLHSFTRSRRRIPFICDACGTEGNYAGYICCTCNIIVHDECISLPRIIKSKWHDYHCVLHTYFLQEEDFESWDCIICHEEVNAKYGSYYCSYCDIIFHVSCVTMDKNSYSILSSEDEDEKSDDSIIVIERNDVGEATKVKHCKHICDLMLKEKTVGDNKCCEGCMLPICASFYYCSKCEFSLHKACAELSQKKHVWHHDCKQHLILTAGNIFLCVKCHYWSSGLFYKCNECEEDICLRCVIALTPGSKTCPGHEHCLFYYKWYKGKCSACGEEVKGAFRCKNKGCNFSLDYKCFSLPTTTQHKCDKHLLALTYHDVSNYSQCYYCDICEESRDQNHWFYHCEICDTSAHIDCVLGEFRFIKLGSILKMEEFHPHPVTVVKKIYYYPDCFNCVEPCQDFALECVESGCEYIVHGNSCE